jgi:hypothetical protein
VRSTSDIGALARIGTDEVLATLGLARSGRVYDLGLEINEQMPQGARGGSGPGSANSPRPAHVSQANIVRAGSGALGPRRSRLRFQIGLR